jgi:hypothetical protein
MSIVGLCLTCRPDIEEGGRERRGERRERHREANQHTDLLFTTERERERRGRRESERQWGYRRKEGKFYISPS